MKKIDRRKNYYLTLDTETAGTLDAPLAYDIGGCIHDKKGVVYETFSFIVPEIFSDYDLMQSAYYADKIPQYLEEIHKRNCITRKWFFIKNYIAELCKKYNVVAIMAYNAFFDYKATKNTQTYLTHGKYKYFLPYGVPIWDILKMTRGTLGKSPMYKAWCIENGFAYGKNNDRPRLTAEIVHRYLTGNQSFIESHTALADSLIEKDIFCYCMRTHKKFDKALFKERK